jgi:hypothetical protein
MNRRAPLLLLLDPSQMASGLMPDRHQLATALWEAALNVRFYQGKVRRLVPAALMFATAAGASRGLSQHQDSTGTRWVWTTSTSKVYRWYGPAAELIIDLSAGYLADQTSQRPASYYDFVHWGNWTIINSSYGAAKLYKPGSPGTIADLANAPTDVVCFLKKQNQLVAVGYGNNGQLVGVSKADDIENWAFTDPTSTAVELPFEEFNGRIRAGCRIGQYISVYAEDQMGLLYWVGAPDYYGRRVVLDGIGCVGKMAVTADGKFNYGVSRNGCWRTDGNSYDYIDEGIISDYLQENVNWLQSSKIQVVRNDVQRCIEFYFPMGVSTDITEGWSFDPSSGGWSMLPPHQVGMERVLFAKPLYASGGSVYLAENDPAAAAALTLETKPCLVQTAEGVTLHIGSRVDEVELACKRASSVQFSYGVSEDPSGPWTWSTWQTIDTTLRTYQLEQLPSGTFHKLRFQSTSANWDLDLQGIALYGINEGQKRTQL